MNLIIIVIPVLVAVAIFGFAMALLEDTGKGTEIQDKRIDDIRQAIDINGEGEEKASIIQKVKTGISDFKEKETKKTDKRKRNKKLNNIDNMLIFSNEYIS